MRSSTILLDALPAAESETLLDLLSSNGRLDAAARQPHPRDRRRRQPALHRAAARRRARGRARPLPDSIQMLLAARLDRLDEQIEPSSRRRPCAARRSRPRRCRRSSEEMCGVAGDARPARAHPPRRGRRRRPRGLVLPARLSATPPTQACRSGGAPSCTSAWPSARSRRGRTETPRRRTTSIRPCARGSSRESADGCRPARRACGGAPAPGWPRRRRRATGSRRRRLLARACELLPREALSAWSSCRSSGRRSTWRGEPRRRARCSPRRMPSRPSSATRGSRRGRRLATMLALMWGDAPVRRSRCSATSTRPCPCSSTPATTSALAMAELVRFHAFDRGGLPSPEQRFSVALEHARKAGDAGDRAPRPELDLHHVAGGQRPGGRGDRPRPRRSPRPPHSAYVHASARGALGLLRAARASSRRRGRCRGDAAALEELGLRQSAAGALDRGRRGRVMAGDERPPSVCSGTGSTRSTAPRRAHDGQRRVAAGARAGAARARRRGGALRARRGARPDPGLWVDVWWRVVLALVEAHRGDYGVALRHCRGGARRHRLRVRAGEPAWRLTPSRVRGGAARGRARRTRPPRSSPRRPGSPSGSATSSRAGAPRRLSAR